MKNFNTLTIAYFVNITNFPSMSTELTWVQWFLKQDLGKYFIEIDSDYLNNLYNYYGIRQKVMNFKQALDLIRGPYIPPEKRPSTWVSDVDDYGICLYGLLHARYLLTDAGLEKMKEKFLNMEFSKCPRTYCDGCQCIPYGPSDDIGKNSLKLFCPCCHDVYHMPDPSTSSMDGAFFGPSWVHLFIAKYKDLFPPVTLKKYTPRIFGFKICPESSLNEDSSSAE